MPTKSDLSEVAVGVLTVAREAAPELDWKWDLSDKYQEWDAKALDATLLQLVIVYQAVAAHLYGWKMSCNNYETFFWCRTPLPAFRHAHEFEISLDFNSEGIFLQVSSDIGKRSPHDKPDPDDPERWIRLEEWKVKRDAAHQ
jgi:hypothetical protein